MLVFGAFAPKGDLTAHMQLQEALPPDTSLGGEVQYAGGVKPDGTWEGNSLFNNMGFRKEMNAAFFKQLGQDAKKELRAKLKDGYVNVECTDDQLQEAQKLFRRGDYKIVSA
eukprot:CAMPEP_0119346450 /NCGR_PEP_ID=MMETSP1333-20130426/108009_1 /TAXON_ID=418940 /ORGANISM="Scyphosphaera apsteinii, Strain RCC1455" /LENGTH=111 /DNA_ID=CAMNT_0007358951 /DNA_START=1004 /DNA_END=1339 /DNA_ORIENTATION=+